MRVHLAHLILLACCAAPLSTPSAAPLADTAKPVQVVQLRDDVFVGPPEGPGATATASNKVDRPGQFIVDGVYTSPYQGYQVRLPLLFDAERVSLHQSQVSRRPDGTTITSHLRFVPDGVAAVGAIVVTRLREDRPKLAASVLAQFEPQGADAYAAYAKQGIAYKKSEGPFGTVLQRSIRNRVPNDYFPYRVNVDTAPTTPSLGVSRYVVMGDFLCEFAVVLGAGLAASPEALQARAERELDALMAAVIKKPQ